jgi:hypothetical protein
MRGANLKVTLMLPLRGRPRPRRLERSLFVMASQKYAVRYGFCNDWSMQINLKLYYRLVDNTFSLNEWAEYQHTQLATLRPLSSLGDGQLRLERARSMDAPVRRAP